MLASGFLETPSRDDAGAPTSLAGQRIGAYTLVRFLGMGGMGSVWLARRSDGRFDADVALKLVNLPLLDGSGGQERFRCEGTALARLARPNIARLFDAGVTAVGQPCLVLEYIQGTRIDHYAADRRLGLRARLDLFTQVADAVAHAHANHQRGDHIRRGIVHIACILTWFAGELTLPTCSSRKRGALICGPRSRDRLVV